MLDTINDADRIFSALTYIDAADRDMWLRMGMAVKSELGEHGFDAWDTWGQTADSYNATDSKTVWRSVRPDGKVGIGSLFHEAKQRGWRDDGTRHTPTTDELAERQRAVAERAAADAAEIERERTETGQKAAAILKAASAAKSDNPYLARKQVSPTGTLREIEATDAARILGYVPKSRGEALGGPLLVVPVKQGGTVSTVELIDGKGRKTALAGRGSKAGGHWATRRPPDDVGVLLVGEGVATVLSASEATGHVGIAALSSGNLVAVAQIMRERHPDAELVLLADLVKATGLPDPHAVQAALAVGGKLAVPDVGPERDPGDKDFNDMLVALGAEAVKQAVASAGKPAKAEYQGGADSTAEGECDAWGEPLPLTAKIEPEPYPIDALPTAIRAAVEEVQGFVKAPLPLVAGSALAALSLACQTHVDVKRAEKLHGPVGLFLLTIADSGERKSTCDGFFSVPIRDYEAAQAEEVKPALKDHAAALSAWTAKCSGVTEKIRQQAKEKKPTAEFEAALRDLQHDKPEPPRVPRMIYTDITPEELGYRLAKGWPSAGVLSSEAGVVLGAHGMGSDSAMRNMATLNLLWDGATISADRRSTESWIARGARLTVALQVQEPTLRDFFRKQGTLARGTGFLARFLIAWPASTQGARPFTEAPANWPSLAVFHRRIAAILDQPAPIDDEGALEPVVIPLSPEAKAAWIEFHDAIEEELASGGDLHDVRDVASKSADNAARLAALFQMFEYGTGAVSYGAFEGASRIAAWHLSEARRFFGELALPGELADAARIDTWLIEQCKRDRTHMVGKNHVRQHGPLRDGNRLDAALRELVDLGRLRVLKEARRLTIHVNPALLEAGA